MKLSEAIRALLVAKGFASSDATDEQFKRTLETLNIIDTAMAEIHQKEPVPIDDAFVADIEKDSEPGT